MKSFQKQEITIRHQENEDINFSQLNIDCGTAIQRLREDIYDSWLPVFEIIDNRQYFDELGLSKYVRRTIKREAYTNEVQALLTKIFSTPATTLGVNGGKLGEHLEKISQTNAEIIRIRNIMLGNQWQLTITFASRFSSRYEPLDYSEVLSGAQAGIVRAAERFNPSTGNQFSTYAFSCMHSEILDARNEKRKYYRHTISLDKPRGREKEGTLHDVLTRTRIAPEEQIERFDLLDHAWQIIHALELDPIEKELVQMLYIGQEKKSFKIMAEELHLSVEQVRQRIARLERKVSHARLQLKSAKMNEGE